MVGAAGQRDDFISQKEDLCAGHLKVQVLRLDKASGRIIVFRHDSSGLTGAHRIPER